MADPYGTDLGLVIGPTGVLDVHPTQRATGRQVLINSLVRRYTTKTGTLPRHPEYGDDVLDLRGRRLTSADVADAEARLARQGLRDDRLRDVRVAVTLTGMRAASVRIDAVPADGSGPFALVLALTADGAIPTILDPTRPR
jgi:hypothetical protein